MVSEIKKLMEIHILLTFHYRLFSCYAYEYYKKVVEKVI